MTTSSPTGGAAAGSASRPSAFLGWQAVVGGAAAATLLNLVVLLVAESTDAAMILEVGGEPDEVGAGDVIFMSLAASLVGLAVAVLLARWKPVFWRVGQAVAAATGALSGIGPLTQAEDNGTGAALFSMHLITGAAAVVVLEIVRRRHR